jgi:uncharacterized protein (DUF4415 family)
MSKTDTRIVLDLANLPPLTEKQRAEIERLKAVRDEDIDLSDMPELTEEFWKNAIRRQLFKPTKTSTTVRIDSDVLAWLKSFGRGHQTRLNAILREAMLKDLGKP